MPPVAFVFDAYGTLFDVHSVAALAEQLAPGNGAALSRLWRTKQLEYTWLQSLMATSRFPREDFAALTAHALDYAISASISWRWTDLAFRLRQSDSFRRTAGTPPARRPSGSRRSGSIATAFQPNATHPGLISCSARCGSYFHS